MYHLRSQVLDSADASSSRWVTAHQYRSPASLETSPTRSYQGDKVMTTTSTHRRRGPEDNNDVELELDEAP